MGVPLGKSLSPQVTFQNSIDPPQSEPVKRPVSEDWYIHFTSDLEARGLSLNSSQWTFLQDLKDETDEILICEDLIRMASKPGQGTHATLAHFIFSWLETWAPRHFPGLSLEHGKRIRQKRLAFSGQGSFGLILERSGNSFISECLDPAMIGSMMVAFPLSRWVQFKTWKYLSQLAPANALSRAWPSFLLAKTTGFAAELGAFVTASKGIQALLGRRVDLRGPILFQETRHMAGMLLFLKGGTGLGRSLWRWVKGPALPPHGTWMFLIQWTGVVLGQDVLGTLQWGPKLQGEQNLFESLKFLIQMEVGGQLGQRFLGPLPSRIPIPRFHVPRAFLPLTNSNPGFQLAGPTPLPISAPLLMEGMPRGTGSLSPRAEHLRQVLSQHFGVGPSDSRILKTAKAMDQTPFQFEADVFWQRYRDLVLRFSTEPITLKEGSSVAALDMLRQGSEIIRHVMASEPFRRGTGSFYDSMIQTAFEHTLELNHSRMLAHLFQVITLERSQSALENFFYERALHHRYQFRESVLTLALKSPLWRRRLKALGLPHQVHASLASYLATYSQGGEAAPFRDPYYNFILIKGQDGKTRTIGMDGEYALKFLEQHLSSDSSLHKYEVMLQEVVARANVSRVPLLYFDRLFKILATGGLPEKVAEIASPDVFHWGSLYSWVSPPSKEGYLPAARIINGSLYTGYVSDLVLAEKFAQFYHAIPLLARQERAKDHLQEFYRFADLTLGKQTNFGRAEVVELLFHRPTPLAKAAREALLSGEVHLEVLSKEQMETLSKNYQPDWSGDIPEGIFLPSHRSPTGRPHIALQEINPGFSRKKKIVESVYLAAIAVHEFEHYRHHQDLGPFSPSTQMRSEMRAWLEEHFYLMQQGEVGEWRRSRDLSPEGFGVYLRKLIDLNYLDGPKDLVVR